MSEDDGFAVSHIRWIEARNSYPFSIKAQTFVGVNCCCDPLGGDEGIGFGCVRIC